MSSEREGLRFQNCYADGACYQLPRPAIKAYKVGYSTQAGHTVSAEPSGHTACYIVYWCCVYYSVLHDVLCTGSIIVVWFLHFSR